MKRLIAVCVLILALPLLAAERREVSVKIPATGPDSLLADSIEKQVRAVNPLMGQVIITNSKFRIIGYVTDDPKALQDTVKIDSLKIIFPGIIKGVEKIKLMVIPEQAP